MARNTERDWVAIKSAYVQGFEVDGVRLAEPTLFDVEKRFGVPESTLRKRSMTEKWSDERRLFQKRVEETTREKSTEILASKGAEFDALSLRVAERMLIRVAKALDGKGVTPAQFRALAGTAKDAQAIGRLVMGDSTENQRLYAELLQKPDLSSLTPDELEVLEKLLSKAKPAGSQ